MAKPPRHQVTFQLVGSMQNLRPTTKEQVSGSINRMAHVVLEDFAMSQSDKGYQTAKQSLARDIERIVREEVRRMANYISKGIISPDNSPSPHGVLKMKSDSMAGSRRENFMDSRGNESSIVQGVLSNRAQSLGWGRDMEYDVKKASQIRWAERDPLYMRRKRREGGSPHWNRGKGQLERWLRQRSERAYLTDFGNVSVQFTKAMTLPNYGQFRVTRSGVSGRPTFKIAVGKLSVRVFGKLSGTVLAGLAGSAAGPFNSRGIGVAAYLPDNKQAAKLRTRSFQRTKRTFKQMIVGWRTTPVRKKRVAIYGRRQVGTSKVGEGKFRPAMDPFVAYFLNRAIPNAIWRRTERFTRG